MILNDALTKAGLTPYAVSIVTLGLHMPSVRSRLRNCPSCRKEYDPATTICVACGIDIRTGRSLITAQAIDAAHLREKVRNILEVVSWFIPVGLYPVASEARNRRRQFAVWILATITTAVSIGGFFAVRLDNQWADDWSWAMLWLGHQTSGHLFRWYQLLTHMFLHADVIHLAGNMVFLLILGGKVNGMIGNVLFVSAYILLGFLAGLAEYVAAWSSGPIPMLGASGAVMGIAGMYVVLHSVERVHMTAWIRPLVLISKTFTLRGYAVVLLYLSFDVLYVVMNWKDNVAHWAHLGGFISGVLLGLGLLVTKQVNANGSDILSAVLGPGAWRWIGTPLERQRSCSFLSRLP